MNELELVRWGTARIANLQWSMGDAEGADEVLDLLRDRVTHHGLQLARRRPRLRVAAVRKPARRRIVPQPSGSWPIRSPRRSPWRGPRSAAVWRWRCRARNDEAAVVAERGRRRREQGRRPAALPDRVRRDHARWPRQAISMPPRTVPPTSCASRRRASTWPGGWPMCWAAGSRSARGQLPGHRVPHGADRRRTDVGIGGVVELPGPAAAGAVVLCARAASEAGAKMVAELRTRYGRHVAVFGPQLRITEALAGCRGGKRQRRNRFGA